MWFHAEIKLSQTRAAAVSRPYYIYFISCMAPSWN